jgi:hypothetical protein
LDSGTGDVIITGRNVNLTATDLLNATSTNDMTLQSTGGMLDLLSSQLMTINSSLGLGINAGTTLDLDSGQDITIDGGLDLNLLGTSVRINAPTGGNPAARTTSTVQVNPTTGFGSVTGGSSSVLIGP